MQYKPNKRYTEAFRLEAVRRSIETPGTLAQLAVDLDINIGLLHRWRRIYLSDNNMLVASLKKTRPPEKSYKALEAENRQLKKQLERAKTDAEILKKAQEYFAEQRRKDSSS